MLQTVDLFSGIGGFSRGLEATGFFKTTRFVENDPYCQAVLRHHWPDIPVLGDIKSARRPDFPERTDLVCGGFPCQPFSQAGKQQAQDDPRHLWPEMFRIIRELRPTWVCGENVTGLVRLGLDEVLTDLEGEGYATRTFNIPACATGAPHLRQRLWIIAHANSESEPDQPLDGGAGSRQLGFEFVADTNSNDGERKCGTKSFDRKTRLEHRGGGECSKPEDHWSFEPEVGRLVNGLPNRVPQLRALGNSIIPQIAERIGYAIASTSKGE